MTIEKARRTLQEIKDTAAHASLTGSLRHGSGVLIKAYNAIFKQAIAQQWLADDGIVTEINIDEIGSEWKERMDYLGCAAGLFIALIEEK